MRLTYFSPDDFEKLKEDFQREALEGKRTAPCPLPEWIECDCSQIKKRIGAEDHICVSSGSCVVRIFLAEKAEISECP